MSQEDAFADRVLGNYDWYAPRVQWHLEEDEVLRWLREEGFQQIWANPKEKIRIVATKTGAAS